MTRLVHKFLPALMLSAALLTACFQSTETPEKVQVQTLRERIINLKELLSPEFLDTLYREYETMKGMSMLLTDSVQLPSEDAYCIGLKKEYLESFSRLDSCLKSCNSLQKEISFLENELDQLDQSFHEGLISEAEFKRRFRQEAEWMNGITERVYRGYNRSQAQLEIHRRIFPELRKCLARADRINP